jgi:nitrate reductase gamma subunit
VTVTLYVIVCGAVLTFVAASAVRVVTYARRPIHLRWELYPVPHEPPERAQHGGSYFELGEWWRSSRRTSLVGDLKFMVPEMLLLKGLRESNRSLWRRSFPFHAGLYLLAATAGLLVVTAIALMTGVVSRTGAIAQAVGWLYAATGAAGLVLTVGGATALLHRRLANPALRALTTPGDVCNLLFFIAAFGMTGLAYLARPAGTPGALASVMGLLSWDTSRPVPAALGCGIVAVALLVAYIPFTHMSHFIAKYFTYHRVRWDDAPLAGNQRMAATMASYLSCRPTWAADHMRAKDGGTWADIVSSNPAREEQR